MVLGYMHMHIDMVGFKRHKLSKDTFDSSPVGY